MRGRGVRRLFLIALASTTLSCCAAATEKRLALYHSVNSRDFTKRGTLVLDASKESLEVRVENDLSMEKDDVDTMMDTGLYQLKVVDEAKNVQVMTSVSACQLRRANFRDEIAVTLGPRGSVLSVTYTPFVSPLAPPCEEMTSEKHDFDSKGSYETTTPGMTIPLVLPQMNPPAGLKFFPRKESVGGDRLPVMPQGEDQQQHQTFVRRYWYIILPLFLISLLGGGEQPSPQQQQQQGGAAATGPQPAVAATPAAPAPAGSGGATRRRGKRS